MAVNDHAALAPSSAHIWAPAEGCRGSVALQLQYPSPEDSPEAREGTAAHWYVSELLLGRDVLLGAVAPNGHPINAEMVDAAQGILMDIRDTIRANPGGVLHVERKVSMAHHVHGQCFGTPDAVYIDVANRRVFVWDFKYGHRFVDAIGNWQLLLYLIGVLEAAGFYANVPEGDPRAFAGWTCYVSIAQPRNYHGVGPIREWHLSGGQVVERLPQLRAAADEAMTDGAGYRTGDHCRDCSGRHACPALQRAAALAMDVSLHAEPVNLPPHAVGLELRQITDAIKRLEARQTGLEEQALGLIRGGTLVPFFTVEATTGQERWNIPAEQVLAVGKIFDVDLSKSATLTPKQARKAGIPTVAIEGMTEQPRGALRLTRVHDDAAKLAFE